MSRLVIAAFVALCSGALTMNESRAESYLFSGLGGGVFNYNETFTLSVVGRGSTSSSSNNTSNGIVVSFGGGYRFFEPIPNSIEVVLEYSSATVADDLIEIGVPLRIGLLSRIGYDFRVGSRTLEPYVLFGGLMGLIQREGVASTLQNREEAAFGIRAGGGAIYRLTDSWGVRLQYDFSWLRYRVTSNLQVDDVDVASLTSDSMLQYHDVTIGIQYSF